MITIPGALTVTTIHGRHGPFNVGKLLTDVGEFTVKERFLDELEEGRYEGQFHVNKIAPHSYTTSGRFVIEVRAFVEDITLDGVDALKPEERDSIEPQDPINTESEETPADLNMPQMDDVKALFAGIDISGPEIKLDSSAPRGVMREQIRVLRERGFVLDLKRQTWRREK
jgi:hypothetical protein